MGNAGSMAGNSKIKRTVVKVAKSRKFVSAGLGLFLGTVGVIAYVKQCTTKNVTGEWHVKFTIEKSAYKPFIGETHTQKIFFTQKDNVVSGDGEKWEYNGKYLPADMHRELEYEGTINGQALTAKYVLHGRDRDSKGIINVEVSSDGKSMNGTFSGTAGESSGTVIGEKK